VASLNMAAVGFVRAERAATGRLGYDPRDLLPGYELASLRDFVCRPLRQAQGRPSGSQSIVQRHTRDWF
jgi:hypothetical protein